MAVSARHNSVINDWQYPGAKLALYYGESLLRPALPAFRTSMKHSTGQDFTPEHDGYSDRRIRTVFFLALTTVVAIYLLALVASLSSRQPIAAGVEGNTTNAPVASRPAAQPAIAPASAIRIEVAAVGPDA